MTQREIDLKVIINAFSLWEVTLSNHNSLNLQDLNSISEYTICSVLNCIYGYNLKNVNAIKMNHPGIDLVDDENNLAFQITTTKTVQKIQETLDQFMKHNLHNVYSDLFIFILGKRQRDYPSLRIPSDLSFDSNRNIIDFKSLLLKISDLPSSKLNRLRTILNQNQAPQEMTSPAKAAARQKKTLAMEKKFCKDFLNTNLTRNDWINAQYEPRIKFNFGSAIVREVGDRTFPNGDPDCPKWVKLEFWDLYQYGVEFVRQAGYIIVDDQGYWDLISFSDERKSNPNYKKINAWAFYRLAFDNIVTYDLDPDGYYGYPTIYCHFIHDGWPWDEIIFGRMGSVHELQATFYFENRMRKELF